MDRLPFASEGVCRKSSVLRNDKGFDTHLEAVAIWPPSLLRN
jgi:hypothetical protein